MTQPVPHGFTEALGTPFNEHSVRVAGRDIVYRARGPADGSCWSGAWSDRSSGMVGPPRAAAANT